MTHSTLPSLSRIHSSTIAPVLYDAPSSIYSTYAAPSRGDDARTSPEDASTLPSLRYSPPVETPPGQCLDSQIDMYEYNNN